MNRERILLLATGTALIVLVVAVAAFSLGVYVGSRGWTAGEPAVAGPGQPPVAPARQLNAPAGNVPAGNAPAGNAPAGNVPAADAPAGNAPAVGGPVAGRPDVEPPGPQLVGRVRSRSGDTIRLDTPQGARLFQLGPGVQVARVVEGQAEAPASLQQVQPGRQVAVFGQFSGAGTGLLIARRLLLLPPAQP